MRLNLARRKSGKAEHREGVGKPSRLPRANFLLRLIVSAADLWPVARCLVAVCARCSARSSCPHRPPRLLDRAAQPFRRSELGSGWDPHRDPPGVMSSRRPQAWDHARMLLSRVQRVGTSDRQRFGELYLVAAEGRGAADWCVTFLRLTRPRGLTRGVSLPSMLTTEP
jgi:hypothetical protein